MSLIKVNKNENPYDVIGNYIEKHIPVIDNVIAVISIDGTIHNELLLVEITYNNNFVWLNDWWEGEENVELIDFFFVSEACKKYNNNDFISRQSAINALRKKQDDGKGDINRFYNTIIYHDIETIKQLSSIQLQPWEALTIQAILPQSDIIRCKDCKYWMPYDWMFGEVWQSQNIDDYPEDEIGCQYCDMTMKANDFCSRAKKKEVSE